MKIRYLTAALAGALAMTACSTTDPNAESGGVRTAGGVTDTEINIGVLTDLTGPFRTSSPIHITQMRAYWKAKNDAGGVCGRTVNMDVRDHGYDPQKAVSLYRGMSGDVVALQQVLGSPVVAAILPLAEDDGLYVGGMGWASVAAGYEVAQIPGSTYSVEAANAVDYFVEELGVKRGDRIGHVYFTGDYGGDALKGAQHAAKAHGVEIVPLEITPQDTDLSAQATTLTRRGVSAVLLSAAADQLTSLAGVLASQGTNVPLIGNTPTFQPGTLNTPARQALLDNAYALTPVAPYDSDAAGVKKARDLYAKADPDGVIGWEVPLAYAQAELLFQALRTACDAGDLTPEGVVKAMRSQSNVDTEGIFPGPLDFTKLGEPPTREVFISKVDDKAKGGLRPLTTLNGESAQSYEFK